MLKNISPELQEIFKKSGWVVTLGDHFVTIYKDWGNYDKEESELYYFINIAAENELDVVQKIVHEVKHFNVDSYIDFHAVDRKKTGKTYADLLQDARKILANLLDLYGYIIDSPFWDLLQKGLDYSGIVHETADVYGNGPTFQELMETEWKYPERFHIFLYADAEHGKESGKYRIPLTTIGENEDLSRYFQEVVLRWRYDVEQHQLMVRFY